MTQSVFNATVNPPDPAWYGSYTLAFNGGGGGAPCFLGSARVLTTQGYKRFDSLNLDDTIQTADSRAVAIKAIRKTPVTPSTSNNPYLIPVGSFGATEEILVSPRHRIFVNGMAHEARNLGLEQQDMTSAWVYYNIELPNWNTDNMIVGGVEVKSLAPVRHAVMTIEQFCRVAARQFGKSVLEPKMLCKSCFKIAFSTVIKWKQIS